MRRSKAALFALMIGAIIVAILAYPTWWVNHNSNDTAVDAWDIVCPDTEIRVEFGGYFSENFIETNDGNIWELNTENINPYQCLMIFFDTMGTLEIDDDQIVDVWTQLYD